MSKLAIQLGVDAAANVLKEFAPDLDRLFSKKPSPAAAAALILKRERVAVVRTVRVRDSP